MRKMKRSLLATSIALAMMAAPSLQAQTVNWNGNGGVDSTDWFETTNWNGGAGPVPGSADDANIDVDHANNGAAFTAIIRDGNAANINDLTVGNAARGRMLIANGSLNTNNAVIAAQAGSDGEVTINAGLADSTWTNAGNLDIGKNGGVGALLLENEAAVNVGGFLTVGGDFFGGATGGQGTLDVASGSSVQTGDLIVGASANSTGTVTVSGADSVLTVLGNGIVGFQGNGDLTVSNGGTVNAFAFAIGLNGTGNATIEGGTLNAGGQFSVGAAQGDGTIGSGTLTIGGGGAVNSGNSIVGASLSGATSGKGEVLVADGTWTTGDLVVGIGDGGDGLVTVGAGGTVNSASAAIGIDAGSIGTVNLAGAGAVWSITGDLTVGNSGNGHLFVLDGAVLNSGDTTIGALAGSDSAVTIEGAGSIWNNNGVVLSVGQAGNGSLTVSNGGSVVAQSVLVGATLGSTGKMLVEGPGSEVTATGTLFVGGSGNGTLAILDGGIVQGISSAQIGFQVGDVGNVLVDGAGSSLINTGNFEVGFHGTGSLVVQNGGLISSQFFSEIGGQEGTGVVILDGAGSGWINSGELRIGNFGTGTLVVRNGATVNDTNASLGNFILGDAPSSGTAIVDGIGSFWANTGNLRIGGDSTGTLTVSGGGRVDVGGDSTIANGASSASTATVTGAGSVWNAGNLLVANGGNALLNVMAGGQVSANGTRLGGLAGSNGTILVDGATSTLNAGNLQVGEGGNAQLNVSAGGRVIAGVTELGGLAGSNGAVVVDGDGSALSADTLIVGLEGAGSLTIQNRAKVDSGSAGIGTSVGATGTVIVDNGIWNLSSGANKRELFVGGGFGGGQGALTIRNGGQVDSLIGLLGAEAGSQGTASVEGGSWTTEQGVAVGSAGTGTFAISAGGMVSGSDGVVGRFAGSTGTATVTGAGSSWSNANAFGVGFEGTGTVSIRDGGTVSSGAAFIAASAGSTGILNIGGAVGEAAAASGTLDTPSVQFGDGAGTINFNHTDARYVFDAAVSGNGAVNVLSGTTVLTAANTYTGLTRIDGGTLLVKGGLSGGLVSVGGSPSFDGTLGGDGTIDGGVVVNNGGTLAPGDGVGRLTINNGLSLATESHLAYELGQAGGVNDLLEIGGDLVLDGTLDITDIGGFGPGVSRLMNYSGALTDNGLDFGLRPTGVEAKDLFVQTGFDGQINLVSSSGATLEFWDGGSLASHDDGTIQGGDGVWNADNRNWTQADGAINGPARTGFTIFGGSAGAVAVEGEQAFTGAQFTADGYQLTAGANGALHSDAAETILRVDPTLTATIAVPLRGATRLVKTDSGTLVLNGASAYTGGVRVAGGKLVGDTGNLLGHIVNLGTVEFAQATDGAQAGAISGSGQLVKSGAGKLTLSGVQNQTGNTAINAGTLAFTNNQSRNYAGVFSGTGTLEKAGTGTLALSGDSSAFAGSTAVNSGELRVDGALGGATTIADGARLSGSGRVQNLATSGTVAPGASIGTLTVNGNYTQNAGSTYEAEIDAAGQSDRIAVTGTAQLSGRLLLQGQANQLGATYTLLTAGGGVSGQFATFDNAVATPFLDLALRYDPNAVFVDVSRSAVTFGSLGFSRNQVATGRALDRLSTASPLIGALLPLDLPTGFGALDQLSGEIHASTRGALVEDGRFVREAVGQRLREGQDDADRAGWAQAYGNGGSIDHDGNAAETDNGSGGVLFGTDKILGDVRVGLMGGAGRISVRTDERRSNANSDSQYFGVYSGTSWGAWGLRAGALYGRHDVETERNVAFGGLSEQLRANYDARALQGFVEAAYRIDAEKSSFEPYVNLAQVSVRNDGYQETGGIAALRGEQEDSDTGFATLGVRASTQFRLGETPASLHGGFGWRHAFGDELPLSHHVFAGGDTFVIAGAAIAEDVATASARLDLQMNERATLGLGYSGQVGEHSRENSVQAQVQVKF